VQQGYQEPRFSGEQLAEYSRMTLRRLAPRCLDAIAAEEAEVLPPRRFPPPTGGRKYGLRCTITGGPQRTRVACFEDRRPLLRPRQCHAFLEDEGDS